MSDHSHAVPGEVPRKIEVTASQCPSCHAALVLTRDAIGRPRYRCPQCQGVNRAPEAAGTVGHLHRQEAASPDELAWSMQPARAKRDTARLKAAAPARPTARPVPTSGTPWRSTCAQCGAALPTQVTGRPRQRCADKEACARRARKSA